MRIIAITIAMLGASIATAGARDVAELHRFEAGKIEIEADVLEADIESLMAESKRLKKLAEFQYGADSQESLTKSNRLRARSEAHRRKADAIEAGGEQTGE